MIDLPIVNTISHDRRIRKNYIDRMKSIIGIKTTIYEMKEEDDQTAVDKDASGYNVDDIKE
jgi:hypothetical protein